MDKINEKSETINLVLAAIVFRLEEIEKKQKELQERMDLISESKGYCNEM